MKKSIVFPLIICCLAVYCTPPPKRPKKKDQLRLENLIYSVALSSLRMAHRMDANRKDDILEKMENQLQQEREQSAVALAALKEHFEDLVNSRSPAVAPAGGAISISMSESQADAIPFEEKLAQLETLVFGGDVEGILFQVKFLKRKLSAFSDLSESGETDSAPAAKAELTAQVSAEGTATNTADSNPEKTTEPETPVSAEGTATNTANSNPEQTTEPETPVSAEGTATNTADSNPEKTAEPATPVSAEGTATNTADSNPEKTAEPATPTDTEGAETSEQATTETNAHSTRLAKLSDLIYGIQDSPGILLQLIELKNTFSSISLTPDENQILTEEVTTALQEQTPLTNTDLSVEARLTRLENALLGSAEQEGVIFEIAYLQSQATVLEPLLTDRD